MIRLPEITHLTETCRKCGAIDSFLVEAQDLHDWKSGKLIQDALGYLSVDRRELLITGLCGKCFDDMFGEI